MADSTKVTGHVGPVFTSDGVETAGLRQGTQGEVVSQQSHGKYYEATSRGNVYRATVGASGVAPGTALGTTAAFSLYNPAGSGKRLVVNKLHVGVISGTFTAGLLHICQIKSTDSAPSSGTAITPVNCKIGNGNASVADVRSGSTITTNAGKAIDALCSINKQVTDTLTGPLSDIVEKEIDGSITLEPGTGISLTATTSGAGTSPLLDIGACWEEVPLS